MQKVVQRNSIFRLTNGATTLTTTGEILVLANSSTISDVESFGPFNKFVLRNNSLANVILRLDGSSTGDRSFSLNAGDTIITDADERTPFRHIVVQLNDTVNDVLANEIDATFTRVID